MQLLYVGWQMIMIALTMLMYTVLTYFSIVFYIFESVQRWAASGGIRKRWRLRHRLRHATSYKEYAEAGRELDELGDVALLHPAELVYERYYIFELRVICGLGSKHVRGPCDKLRR